MKTATILCQMRTAETPYYIEDVDLRISTIEELCYYLQHNLPLIDLTFFSMNLLDWLETELEAHRLVRTLHDALTGNPDPQLLDLILPVMQEAGWLSRKEERELSEELRAIDAQPVAIRLKKKADVLVSYRKYTRAIRTYDVILKMKQTAALGTAFAGAVYYNMGVAYARLFQMEEATSCMKWANDLLHTRETLRGYLFCTRQNEGDQAFRILADKLGVDQQTREDLARKMDSIGPGEAPADPDKDLREWVGAYHRETGL